MKWILGIDTSNYTTSAALYCLESGEMRQDKRLLPVKEGELGLRQSDAVFHHTRQLPERIEAMMKTLDGEIAAIGVSEKPCEAEGSYMPCFLAGLGTARSLAAALRVPLRRFTHQQGHVAAAAFGAGRQELLRGEFLAFHVSGGTTDALLVRPSAAGISCTLEGTSLDLKAGQLIDRVGKLLGLPFPAGPALEELALRAPVPVKCPRPVLRDANCSLSGVENQCRKRISEGEEPAQVALFCLSSVLAAVAGMTEVLLRRHPSLPVLYAGGVMSNSLLRRALSDEFGGCFAPPAFSADNAAGIAFLTAAAELAAPPHGEGA